jgi:hypothetical protein
MGKYRMVNYPVWIPALSILLSLSIYTLGAVLLSGFGPIAVLAYILYCLWSEFRVIRNSCRNCYYYGKLCGVGKGIIAPLFGPKGDPRLFTARDIGWKDLIPDMLLFLIPLLGGIIDLLFHFSYRTVALLVAIVVLAMPVTGFVRSRLLCPNCKQRELGCPAEKLFGGHK